MTDLQAELESLRTENARLRRLLKLTDAEAAPAQGTQTAWFDKAPGPVDARSSSQAKVEFYAALFGARRDVYAVRWEDARTSKSGWMPAVEGGWRKGRSASDIRHLPLTPEVLAARPSTRQPRDTSDRRSIRRSTARVRRDARAAANASSPHSHQSTGLSACWSRYGDVADARRLGTRATVAAGNGGDPSR